MAEADVLLMFSDVDGLYDANPSVNPEAKRFNEIYEITPDVRSYASGSGSLVGTGGMKTKLDAAEIAMKAGCHMVIASGRENSPITRIIAGGVGTWFVAKESASSARKKWIAGALHPLGALVVDEGAAVALTKGKSLLAAGVVACKGVFDRGDAVVIENMKGEPIAKGLAAYGAADMIRIMGEKSQQIESLLGYYAGDAVMHRDDMVLL
jgi:glutamate 5-kinase